jgi:ribosomal protein L37AE/L43A
MEKDESKLGKTLRRSTPMCRFCLHYVTPLKKPRKVWECPNCHAQFEVIGVTAQNDKR